MSIKLYNSLTKQKEDFVPMDKKGKRINMYTCGVTVYDKSHIGHARSLYTFDVIRRYFKYRGYDIRFIRNITDVDDKIINKANELGKTSKEVSEQNIKDYYDDLTRLGVDRGDKEPKATENIDEMIRYIEGLIKKGFAYESDGDVYFGVREFESYGKLSGQSIEKMQEAVRINKDEKKKDPLDFALWKKSKEDEPSWNSPWGMGRPGWHIECSCMSLKHLKCDTLDIHAGGRDLIFPHHENEIAQAEAFTGKQFAKYWIHHGLLTINKQKMAKSLGNFITIEDAVEKYGSDDLKMFFISSHYASNIDFSEDRLKDAHKALERFDIFFNEANRVRQEGQIKNTDVSDIVKRFEDEFIEAMDDDFNTPRATSSLFELISEVYKLKSNDDYGHIICAAADRISFLMKDIFGLSISEVRSDNVDEGITKLLEERVEARANKDFKRSDELRDALKENGVIVEDTPQGQTWRRA